MAAIFSKLAALYGQRWTSRFDGERDIDLAQAEWAVGLRAMSGEQVRVALDRCATELDWPPGSPAEFRNLGVVKLAPCHKLAQKQLPRPAASAGVVAAELDAMRRVLRQIARVSLWARLHGMRAYC